MVRIQLHLTADQDRGLRALARARGETRAEVIRRAIDQLLLGSDAGRDALCDLVGVVGGGPGRDISERHDALLYSGEPLSLPRTAERRRRR